MQENFPPEIKPRRSTFISSGILIALSIITLSIVAYVTYLLHMHHLLPSKVRWMYAGILGGLSLLMLILGFSNQGNVKKFFGILFTCAIMLVADLSVLYASSTIRMLNNIQADTNTSQEESNAEAANGKIPQAVHTDKNEPFIVYISGIDMYGQLEDTSRSDVNILAVVNPNTHQVLLVSVPRDTYLPIAGGGNWGYDKLTHAGLYGVSASIETIEEALDIDINYYVRLNFTSFMNIIDAIGGVEVDNPVDFWVLDTIHYPKGRIELDSEEALAFVRERYHLADGDFDRQRNQARVIEGVFRKMMSSELLFRFQGIVETVEESVETNMPNLTLMDFVNHQMENAGEFHFKTLTVPGHGETGLSSYAMPNYHNLYFFVPDEEGLRDIHEQIKSVLDGTYKMEKKSSFDNQDEHVDSDGDQDAGYRSSSDEDTNYNTTEDDE